MQKGITVNIHIIYKIMSNKDRQTGENLYAALGIYRVILFIVSGIISWKIIDPKGFWSVIFFFILWGIVGWLINQIVFILFVFFNKDRY